MKKMILSSLLLSSFSLTISAKTIHNPRINLADSDGKLLGKGRISCEVDATEACKAIDARHVSGQIKECKEIKFSRFKYAIVSGASDIGNLALAILTFPLSRATDGRYGVCDDRLPMSDDPFQCTVEGFAGSSQQLRLQVYNKVTDLDWGSVKESIHMTDDKLEVISEIQCD